MIPMHSIFPRGNQSFALGGILDKKELIYVVLLNGMKSSMYASESGSA